MAIKMRVLTSSPKAKMKNYAEAIKAKYELAFNAVDVIPPAYSCDKERIVILGIAAKGTLKDNVRLFLQELTKERAANVALMIDGTEDIANNIKEILKNAGTNVIDEVYYVNGGSLFNSKVKPEELTQTYTWVDSVIKNLK